MHTPYSIHVLYTYTSHPVLVINRVCSTHPDSKKKVRV